MISFVSKRYNSPHGQYNLFKYYWFGWVVIVKSIKDQLLKIVMPFNIQGIYLPDVNDVIIMFASYQFGRFLILCLLGRTQLKQVGIIANQVQIIVKRSDQRNSVLARKGRNELQVVGIEGA